MPKNINVLYWAMFPYLPRYEGTSKEIALLKKHYGGWVVSPPGSFGRYGWDDALSVKWLDWKFNPVYQWFVVKSKIGTRRCDLVHIFSWRLRYKQWIMKIDKPIVYTCVAKSRDRIGDGERKLLKKIKYLIVSDPDDRSYFEKNSSCPVEMVRPGIEPLNIAPTTFGPFTLLMASAPWKKEHFSLKGIDLIIKAAQKLPEIRWLFLWRGLYMDILKDMTQRAGVTAKVRIINEVMPIEDLLAQAHAVVGIYKDPAEIKIYPHSLLEALSANRPVIVSNTIHLSEIISQMGCGVSVEPSLDGFIAGLKRLRNQYTYFRKNCQPVINKYFSSRAYLLKYRDIYHKACSFRDLSLQANSI